MQLRDIHVDGFGIFANARVRGLTPGLNVLYGRNEFGKTTLLEFIRRVLFGFPTKSSPLNPYPPLLGGAYGGHLTCQLSDPQIPELTVSRTAGKAGGALTISTTAGEPMSEAYFHRLLGDVSDELYRNVFAVSLQELQAAKQLQGEELRNRIYGAGLGLGQKSIPGLKKFFADTAEKLYRPRGSNQVMNDLAGKLVQLDKQIRATVNDLGQYDAKKAQADGLGAEVARLRDRQRTLQADQRSLENQRNLYETFVALQSARAELAPLASSPDIPDSTMDELRTLQQSATSLEEKLQEARSRRAGRQADLDVLTFDPALLEHERDIKSLSRSLTQYRDAQRDLPVLNREQALAIEHTEHSIRELGPDWNVERVRAFVLTGEQVDALRQKEAALRAQEKAAEKARDRLDDYRNQTRSSLSRPSLPLTYRIIGLAVLGLGIAGCVLSIPNGDTALTILSGLAGALGLVVALSLGSSSGPLSDKAMAQLIAEKGEAERLLAAIQNEWSALLESTGLSPSLSPQAVNEQIQSIRALQGSLQTIDERQSRIEDMQSVVRSVADRFTRLVATLSESISGSDVSAGIETMDARLDRAQELRVKRDSLLRESAQLEDRISSLSGQLAGERTRLDALLSGAGVTTVDELVALHQRAARARELRADILRRTVSIQAAVGTGPQFDAFMKTLETTDPESILASLSLVVEQLAAVEADLETANQRIGGLTIELKALASGESLLQMEAEAEKLKQQLRDAYHEWLRAQLALWAIEQAVLKYETTRQPAVIREAQSAFVAMTGGKYDTLLSPLGSDDLRVRDAAGKERSVIDELSRGTREQLYLAMRMGLIEQYEQNSEPLPVIMDDILVNFDDDRGPLAVQALAQFAKDRQVIVMTCHEGTREMYRRAGATELVVERASGAP